MERTFAEMTLRGTTYPVEVLGEATYVKHPDRYAVRVLDGREPFYWQGSMGHGYRPNGVVGGETLSNVRVEDTPDMSILEDQLLAELDTATDPADRERIYGLYWLTGEVRRYAGTAIADDYLQQLTDVLKQHLCPHQHLEVREEGRLSAGPDGVSDIATTGNFISNGK